jgi:hypothetical protein
MPEYRVTIEITRSAYTDIEADSTDEARANAEQLWDEGEMGGWEEDIPQVKIEGLPEEDASALAVRRARVHQHYQWLDWGVLSNAHGCHQGQSRREASGHLSDRNPDGQRCSSSVLGPDLLPPVATAE